jgi:inosose dehydratase
MASCTIPFLARFAQAGTTHYKVQLGCQTNAWPIHPVDSATLFSALKDIHALGFTGFETGFANVMPLDDRPEELKSHALGLTPFGVHIFLTQYDEAANVAPGELIAKVSSVGAAMGFNHLILSGAPAGDPATLSNKIAALNRYGKQISSLGLKLAYHNRGPEFQGPRPEIETLLAGTDPSLVAFLLDAGHAFDAGADVIGFVSRHYNRLTCLHLRDYRNGQQVPLGQGDFPLAALANVLREKNWTGWALAEEERLDGSKLGEAAAGPAFAALHNAFRSETA